MKTDSIGDTLWTRTFGLQPVSSSGEEAHSVRQLNDGSYVFVGVDITMPGPDYRTTEAPPRHPSRTEWLQTRRAHCCLRLHPGGCGRSQRFSYGDAGRLEART